jgi:prolipoprotein diacylglyceryltransferase
MEPFIVVNPDRPGNYYALFYLLSFLTGFVLLMWEGHKRKFPTIPWMMVIATAFLFFMVGVQIIKFSKEDWQLVLQFKELGYSPGRSVIGGILFAIPGLFLAKHFLKFRYDLMDAFAWVAPVGMFVQRFGCFLAGCCYGIPTSAPWGTQYGVSSHAFNKHVHDGLIPKANDLSIAVHPVPLYEMVCCAIIIALLFRIRKHVKVSGNLLIASVCLYGVGRFITEFYRANSFGVHNHTGLTIVQLVILVLIPFLVALIFYREGKLNVNKVNNETLYIPQKQSLIYFLFVSFLFLLFSRWLTILEIVTLNIVMLPMLLFIGWKVYKSVTVPRFRLATVCLVGGSMIMMSQTLPEKSDSDSTKLSYNIFSTGFISNSSNFFLEDIDYAGTDCDGNPIGSTTSTTYNLENSSKIYGFGFSRVEQKSSENVIQYGLDGYWGSHREDFDDLESRSTNVFGVHPHLQYDTKIVGVGLGFHVGNLTQMKTPNISSNGSTITSIKKINFYPSFYFRLGDLNKVFFETKVAQQFPSPLPSLGFQANLGFGFKKNTGGAFRFGVASNACIFIAPTFPIGKVLVIEPFIGGSLFGKETSNDVFEKITLESNFVGSVSLRYKFGRKEKLLR